MMSMVNIRVYFIFYVNFTGVCNRKYQLLTLRMLDTFYLRVVNESAIGMRIILNDVTPLNNYYCWRNIFKLKFIKICIFTLYFDSYGNLILRSSIFFEIIFNGVPVRNLALYIFFKYILTIHYFLSWPCCPSYDWLYQNYHNSHGFHRSGGSNVENASKK